MSFMKSRNSMRRRRVFVRGRDLAGGHLEGGKQRRGAVALVVVAVAGQRPAVGQLQIALRPLQRLDRGLLVDADDDRVLGRRHVQPDHVGRLGGELGIVALAPGLAPVQVDLLRAQKAPDLLLVHVAQFGRDQRSGPARKPGRRRAIQNRQDTPAGLDAVLGRGPGRGLSAKPARPSRAKRPRQG